MQNLKSYISYLTSHNSSRGVSVITVIVTIVVIILIASITIYSGSNLLRQANEDRAYDRLEVIYQALRANEDNLDPVISNKWEEGDTEIDSIKYIEKDRALTYDDYVRIGLESYTKDKKLPQIIFSKIIGGIDEPLNEDMRTYIMSDGTYEKSFEYDSSKLETSLTVNFDAVAGVNRPQVASAMKAIDFSNSEEGEYVDDIYLNRWYSYDFSSPNFANVEIDVEGTKYYFVWIPRYAYKIQDYYKENVLSTVPASAIDIIFLKGTSNLDAHDQVLPDGYIVHPAFTYGNKDLTGIWVEKYSHRTNKTISFEYNKALEFGNSDSIFDSYERERGSASHLLKNSEWAAVAYLAQACDTTKSKISSTGNYSGVCDVNQNRIEYTATYINDNSAGVLTGNGSTLKNGSAESKNLYAAPGENVTLNSINQSVAVGDALVETSNGENNNSAWFNSTTIKPTAQKPFIARGTNDSLFGYKSSNGAEDEAYYRIALMVIGKEIINPIVAGVDSELKQVSGDVYVYEPTLTGFDVNSTYFVKWDSNGNESKILISKSRPSDWYNYKEQKWANILVENNGNKAYFVWIPRYVYKLDSENQISDVRFVDVNNYYKDENGNTEQLKIGNGDDDWKLPEAFTWNGAPIHGYWMSKYQVSQIDKSFNVARYPDKIVITSTTNAQSRLGTGTYKYYRGNTQVGTASYNEEFTFTNLQPNTTYSIKIEGNNGNEVVRNITTIGAVPKLAVSTPNSPDMSGFDTRKTYYVTWDSSGRETLTPATNTPPNDWYNYSQKKWANILVQNGDQKAYFVWIPRFKYKLQYADKKYLDFEEDDTPLGYSDVIFIPTDSTVKAGQTDDEGYTVPLAFKWGDTEISGYWMSKYQVSE